MENRLKKLKPAIDKTIFRDVVFTEKSREVIKNKLYAKDDGLVTILQLLQTRRTGYELSLALIGRGEKLYIGNEGMLYIQLHSLELKGHIRSHWENEEKYYFLSKDGLDYIAEREKRGDTSLILAELTKGALIG